MQKPRSDNSSKAKAIAIRLRRAYESHKGEWLDLESAYEYAKRAEKLPPNGGQDTGEWRRLRMELQERFGLLEVEAFNILRGVHIRDYVDKYQRMMKMIPLKSEMESIDGNMELLNKWLYARELLDGGKLDETANPHP